MSKKTSYAEDCIHLHACRRVTAIANTLGLRFGRHCTQDACECYMSKNKEVDAVPIKTACGYAVEGVQSIRSGYDAYDVYAPQDLEDEKLTLGELLAQACGDEE